MWFLTTLCIWFSKYIFDTIYTHLPGSPSEVESDEEGQNVSVGWVLVMYDGDEYCTAQYC
jgi:hypothetical protein